VPTRPPPVFPVVLAGFTAFLDLYATQPLLPLLMRVFGASHVAVSFTVTASTIAVAVAAPLVGRVADRVGRKRVIVGSAVLLALATGAAATATTLRQLIVWRFVQGLATPGVFAIALVYIHDEWPRSHVGRATAAYISGTVTGGFCGRALAGVLAATFTWQIAFVVLAGANAVAALALAAWLPGERKAAAVAASSHRGSVARLILNQRLIATDGVGFCVLFTLVAMFTYVTFLLADSPYQLSTAALGGLFVVYLLGAVVTPFAGRWIDLSGHRVALASGVGIGLAGALLTLLPSLAAIVVGLALVATGVFISQATASSYIGVVTREDRGLAVGLYSTAYYLGGSLGGALPALFWTAGGWTACVMLVVAVQLGTAGLALKYWTDATAPESAVESFPALPAGPA
jgi:YNFM family putative membrane transporter